MLGAALYLTVVGVLGLGLGALLRNTAAGISALFGVLFVLPIIVRFLPSSWADPITSTCRTRWGRPSPTSTPTPRPWALDGLRALLGYAAVVLVAAAVNLRRRDA